MASDPKEPPAAAVDLELVAEFDRLHEKLNELIQRTQDPDDRGETVRMTLDLPKEWAILAAWIARKRRMRAGGDPGPLRREIDLNPKLGDWQHARQYLWLALNEHFHAELHELALHDHDLLYPPPPKEDRPPEGAHVPGVPREYSKVGITTPQAAAEYSSGVVGFMACNRAGYQADKAEREGRTQEAEFYRAELDILLTWYTDHGETITADQFSQGDSQDENPTGIRSSAKAKANKKRSAVPKSKPAGRGAKQRGNARSKKTSRQVK